jgi:hypothetical protein
MPELSVMIPRMGAAGPQGTMVHVSAVAPEGGDGNIGDAWIRIDASVAIFYGPKTDEGWPAGVSFRGGQGIPGPAGPIGGVPYRFDAGTDEADPGAGTVRASDPDLSLAEWFYLSKTTATGGDAGDWLNSFDDANNARKGSLYLISFENAQISLAAVADVASVDDQGDWVKVMVDPSRFGGATSFNDGGRLSVLFVPSGNDAFATVVLEDNVGPFGFRNKVINGDFEVWQRGTSFNNPTTLSYLADRWRLSFNGTGAARTISRFLSAPGSEGPGGTRYGLRWEETSAGSGSTAKGLFTPIENVRSFAGRTVQLSFVAWVDAGTIDVTPEIAQSFGTGGSPSSQVTVTGSAVTITTTPTRFSQAFAVPSIAGKALGSNGNDHIFGRLQLPTGATFAFNVKAFQIEEGNVVTPFERLDPGAQFLRCARYYYRKNYDGAAFLTIDILAVNYAPAGDLFRTQFQLPAPMRVEPAVALSDGTLFDVEQPGVATHNVTSVFGGNTVIGASEFSLMFELSGSFPAAGYRLLRCGNSGYLEFNAEL